MSAPARNEVTILAETYAYSRELTKFYFGKLKGTDPYYRPDIGTQKANCWAWVAGHLIWAENGLLRTGLGLERMDVPWVRHFKIGSSGEPNDEWPDVPELFKTLKESHALALEGIATISNEELDVPIEGAFLPFLNSKRSMIMHAIRHEALHGGHLSWINQALEIKTF